MKKSVFLALGLVVLVGLVWRIVNLIAQEAGGLLQEKIRVEVIDSWPGGEQEVFPMDVTLAKSQKYEFRIFDSEDNEVIFKRLNSNSFADRETIYLQIQSAARPGKFKLEALSGGVVLRQTEFWWGLVGINFSSWPLEVGISNQIFISGCGDIVAWVDQIKQDLNLVGKCWRRLDYLADRDQSATLNVQTIIEGKMKEKKMEMRFEKNPVFRVKRRLEDEKMVIEYQGKMKEMGMAEMVASRTEIGEIGNAETSVEEGLNKINWDLESIAASNSASYKISVWDPEAMIPIGPLSIWEDKEKKFFEQTTHERKLVWQEPYNWLVPGYLVDNQIDKNGRENEPGKDWIKTGKVGFRLKDDSTGWIIEYKDLASGGIASYNYDPQTSLEDAPLLFGYYKVLVNNGSMLVYEVNKRIEESKEKIDYIQRYP